MFRVRVRATDGLVNVVGGPWSILQKRPETVSGCFQAPLSCESAYGASWVNCGALTAILLC
jgi:hypothetical protein